MRKYIVLLIALFISGGLYAQPWKLKETFKEIYSNKDDPNYVYRTTTKDGKYFIEAFLNSENLKKRFEYYVDKTTGKKQGSFHFYPQQGYWRYVLSFKEDVLKHIRVRYTDGTICDYAINDHRLNGMHTAYYPSGALMEQGAYNDNACFSNWVYFHENGKVRAEGTYLGNYMQLVYDSIPGNLIKLNRYLDTISVEKVTPAQLDSLKVSLNLPASRPFPIDLHYKTGGWKYYDTEGRLTDTEWFDDKGRLVEHKELFTANR